jgi:hypothetical protein
MAGLLAVMWVVIGNTIARLDVHAKRQDIGAERLDIVRSELVVIKKRLERLEDKDG